MGKVTFNGETKLITILTGYTEIDVQIDLYSDWKEWVVDADNAKWLSAFRTFGGDETIVGQFAPRYFFLINNWRIVASGVTCTLQTNLYSEDYDSPFIVFNAAVTNKTSDSPIIETGVQDRLVYGDKIYYDINSIYSGTEVPVGTISQPVNNLQDAYSLSDYYNIRDIYCRSDILLSSTTTSDNFDNFEFWADFKGLTATVDYDNVNNTRWHSFIINGVDFNGDSVDLLDSIINDVYNISGSIKRSTIQGEIDISGDILISDSLSGIDDFILNFVSSGTSAIITSHSGDIVVKNCGSGNTSTINLISGEVEIESSCVGGIIVVEGVGEVIDNSGSGCTVIDKTVSNVSIADAVWDELIAEHLDAGSTGEALYNVSAGATPEVIAAAVWDTILSGHTILGSAGEALSDLSSGTTNVEDMITRILGLVQENFRIIDHVYDSQDLLQTASIRIFGDSTDCDNNVNPTETYSMEAIYDANARLVDYKVTRD